MLIVRGEVTDNNDPLQLGRIKFKSMEYLGGLEHPNWIDPAVPSAGEGWGFFMVPELLQPVFVLIPSEEENHTPVYFACQPVDGRTPDEIKVGYPMKAILKFYDMGYILFDRDSEKITINCTGNIDIIAEGCVKLDAPLVRTTGNFEVGQAASGSFTTSDGKLVTVNAGIVTSIT